MRTLFFLCLGATLLFSFSLVQAADVKTFTTEYTCQAGKLDDRGRTRAAALEGAKERLWKDLWNDLEQKVTVKNLQLSPEQIGAFVPVLAFLRVTDETWTGNTCRITAELTVDRDETPETLKSLARDSARTKDLMEIRKKREECLREMLLLKNVTPARGGWSKGKASLRYAALLRCLTTTDWIIQGFHAEIHGDWKKAKRAFHQAVQMDGKSGTALYHRGLASLKLGQTQQSLKDVTRVVKLNPQNNLAWYLRGIIHVQGKRDRYAIDDFSKSIETNDQYGPAYFQRGLALDRTGRREKAVRDFSKAIELNPEDSQAYLNRGAVYSKLGHKEEAARDLARAIRIDQKHDLTTGLPETPLAGSVQDALSVKELDSVIARDPRNADAYFRRGVAYDNLGYRRQALQDLNKAIELNPQNAAAYFMRGLVYGMIDVQYAAINDIKVSARLGYKPAQDYMNAIGTSW